MADVVRTTRKQSLHMAGVIAGTALTSNLLFWVLSGLYFNDKPQQLAGIGAVRMAFAVLSLIVAGMSLAAALAPRRIGHGLAIAFGIASVIGGIAGLASKLPPVTGLTLLVCGGVLPVIAIYSLKHSRAAWSFLIAMLAVLATVTFFGAPKIRHVLHIGLWTALIIPALQIVAVIALSMVRGEYRNR